MAFKLRSGNTSSFKQMGSSPVKQKSSSGPNMNDPKVEANYAKYKDNPEYAAAMDRKSGGKFEYDEKTRVSTSTSKKSNAAMNAKVKEVKDKNFTDTNNALVKTGRKKLTREEYNARTSKSSPAKQKLNKGGEGQDQDKIFDAKGIHVGDYVNGKKVMHHEQQHKKIVKSSKSAHGQLGDAKREHEMDKMYAKKKKSPAKQVNPKDPKAIEGKHYPSKETVKKLQKGPYAKGGQNAHPPSRAIKGKHYPDKAMVEKLKKGPYTKGGQNASSSKKVNAKTGKGAVSLRDARGGRGSLDFWNQTPDEVKVATRRAGREHYVANDNFSKNKKPANLNMKGGKTTTPGYSTTKAAKKVSKASKFIKGAKKVLKVGGKIAGGLGVAGTLYDMYKSGQEHSGGKAVKGQKSFMADAKKNTKSIFKKK